MNQYPTILCDTREGHPYSFGVLPLKKIKLETGDYSIEHFEDYVSLERKSLLDFVNTVINKDNRQRFFAELNRMKQYPRKVYCVIIEGSFEDIFEHRYESHAEPMSIFGFILSIMTDWGIPVIMAGNRQIGRLICETLLVNFWNHAQKGLKKD